MRPRPSLAFAVGRDLVFAVLACAAALSVALSVQLDMTKRELRQNSLDQAARDVAQRLRVEPDGTAHLVTPPLSSSSSMGYPTLVFDRHGSILLQQPAGLEPALVAALGDQRRAADEETHRLGEGWFFTLSLGKKRIVGEALRSGPEADERVILVWKDEGAPDVLIDEVVHAFPYRSARVLLPLFALLIAAGALIVWRRIRPIAEVSAIAATIGPHALNVRLPEQGLPAELLPIVGAVNGALARLERAAETQRDFLRRAAHQLRTPMMVLSARAAALDDIAAAAQLRGDVLEMSRIVSQLVQLNEIEGIVDTGHPIADLGAVGEAVQSELAERRGARIALLRPDVPVLVAGDPNILEVALRNLVENALQYSPPGAPVTVRVAGDGSIEVGDAGPGIAPELRAQIFEPFWSGNPDHGGAGLGLTIVRRVAERYGGEVSVEDAPGGGTIVALRFPIAAADAAGSELAAARTSIPASLALRRRAMALDRAID